MASGSKAGGSGTQGMSTPETSSSAEALEDEQQPPGENKRKKFHPLRAVRKIFRWKVKRQATPQEVVGPSKKSRSTGELQLVPDDEQRLKVAAVAPYSIGLSVSHDSVFTSDTTSGLGNTQEVSQGSSLSVNRDSHKLMFRDELFTRVQARRDSDDDDIGLPHSPCTSPTTADVLSRGLQAKSSKPQSTCSAGSLSSMFSSENDEDALGQAIHDRRGDAAAGDKMEPLPLSHKAALHKISVKPKRTHALPRNRRIQMLSATPPHNLPTTPEVSEDCARLSSAQAEAVDTDQKHAEASCSSSVPTVLPKPVLPLGMVDENSVEVELKKPSESAFPECSTAVEAASGKEPEDRTKENNPDDATVEQCSEQASPVHPPQNAKQNEEVCHIFKVTEEEVKTHAVQEHQNLPVQSPAATTDEEQLVDDNPTKDTKPKEKHVMGKPKAAELKLRHEIAQFNKRQQEMEMKVSPTEHNGVADEAAAVDVRETIQSLEVFVKQRDSKAIHDEAQDEQRILDVLNGNVIAESDKVGQTSTLNQKLEQGDIGDDPVLEDTSLSKPTSPSKKVSSVSAVERGETWVSPGPLNKRNEAHRRYSCMEPISTDRNRTVEIQRPLSVEIIPFTQRKKDNSPSPPPVNGDTSPKKEEKSDAPFAEQILPSENASEKLPMSYPVHFRIYKGSRRSLGGDDRQNQRQESPPLGPKSWDQTSLSEDKPATHHFEVKIHSTTDMKDRPEVKPKVLDAENKDEMKNFDPSNDEKEFSVSTSEVFWNPQKKDDIKSKPFSRGVQVKGTAENNEPELFKVFARRSLKQKHSDKEPNNASHVENGDAADDKPDRFQINADDVVSVTPAGGTIVKITEPSAIISTEQERDKQQVAVTQNGVSSHDHSKHAVTTEFRSASEISKMFESAVPKALPAKSAEGTTKTTNKSVNIIAAETQPKSVKGAEPAEKVTEVIAKSGWHSHTGRQHSVKVTAVGKPPTDSGKETTPQPRRNPAARPRYHTSPEVAQEDIVKATPKPSQEPAEKPITCDSPKVSRSLHRASSVSSSSPSSSGSFRISKADSLAVDGQPAWLQLAQQRRELREQRERALLGRPAETSFVIETSKPSRSSKVLDMVSNFQKLQMT